MRNINNNIQENQINLEINENIPLNPFTIDENKSSECESEINYDKIENKIYYLKKFNGIYNIIYKDDNENEFYLTCQRFYSKEQLDDNSTLISVVCKN